MRKEWVGQMGWEDVGSCQNDQEWAGGDPAEDAQLIISCVTARGLCSPTVCTSSMATPGSFTASS